MRLLVVTNDYPPKPGGIQQWLGNVVDHFEGEVRVLAPADGPATNELGEASCAAGVAGSCGPRLRSWLGRE